MAEHKNEGMATLLQTKNFFGMTTRDFKNEWTDGGLTDDDKRQIRQGIADGTLTY